MAEKLNFRLYFLKVMLSFILYNDPEAPERGLRVHG